ncbi:MAG: hypothetical protein CL565_04915 [Alphaproteobacteria bacterium]|nr:hypothetical protein [Alphaproteobacteria bacterium]|tara:strand:- start:635 stop:1279 length:645 start_codon:yes stop_codon:yes gene_type:complete
MAVFLIAISSALPAHAQIFLPDTGNENIEEQTPDTAFEDESSTQKPVSWYDYPEIELRALDKITARATTFKTRVGETVRFGDIYIKVQACRKPPAIEKMESAAFIQVWEQEAETAQSRWVFSGWMFASNPALSAMDHVIYDVWVIQCIGPDPEPEPVVESEMDAQQADSDSEEISNPQNESAETPGIMEDSEGNSSDDTQSDDTNRLIDSLLGE